MLQVISLVLTNQEFVYEHDFSFVIKIECLVRYSKYPRLCLVAVRACLSQKYFLFWFGEDDNYTFCHRRSRPHW